MLSHQEGTGLVGRVLIGIFKDTAFVVALTLIILLVIVLGL